MISWFSPIYIVYNKDPQSRWLMQKVSSSLWHKCCTCTYVFRICILFYLHSVFFGHMYFLTFFVFDVCFCWKFTLTCEFFSNSLFVTLTLVRFSTCRHTMGWLRLVGSLELQISFAEYSLFHRALLQKRRIILRSLLIVATP